MLMAGDGANVGIDIDGKVWCCATLAEGVWSLGLGVHAVEEVREAGPSPGSVVYETASRRFRVLEVGAVQHLASGPDDDAAAHRIRNLVALLGRQELFDGRPVQVASALPFDRVFTELIEGRLDEDRLRQWMTQLEVQVVREPVQGEANVIRRDVALRGIAAHYDWTRDDAGCQREDRMAPATMLLDVGIRETTVVTSDARHDLVPAQCAVLPVGYLPLLLRLDQALQECHEVPPVRAASLMAMMGEGCYRARGETWDAAPLLREVACRLAEQLGQGLTPLGIPAVGVVVTGVAAIPLAAALRDLGVSTQVPDQPAYANARGMAKYLREAA